MTNYPQYSPPSAHQPQVHKRLVRKRDDKMIAGVCSGVGDYIGVDPNIVRLVLVAAVVLGFGSGVIAYLVGWALMPQE